MGGPGGGAVGVRTDRPGALRGARTGDEGGLSEGLSVFGGRCRRWISG